MISFIQSNNFKIIPARSCGPISQVQLPRTSTLFSADEFLNSVTKSSLVKNILIHNNIFNFYKYTIHLNIAPYNRVGHDEIEIHKFLPAWTAIQSGIRGPVHDYVRKIHLHCYKLQYLHS